MIIKKLIKFTTYSFCISILINSFSTYAFTTYPENIKHKSEKDLISKTKQKELVASNYLIDSGDILYLDFKGADFFSGYYAINNGELILPEINNVKVSSLSLAELKKKLIQLYEEFIFEPEINIFIEQYRPVNVLIKGEVKSPGLYTLTPITKRN